MQVDKTLQQFPSWLGTAIFGAAVAIFGFVAKQGLSWLGEIRADHRAQRARLIDLWSLLRASGAVFLTQRAQADNLANAIVSRLGPQALHRDGLDATFSAEYSRMTPPERALHDIIRSTTIHAMRPLNEAILSWLTTDTTFRTSHNHRRFGRRALAAALGELETHLRIWCAKYSVWIPDHPDHALVYLADEMQHGPGFPPDLEAQVARVLGFKDLQGA